MKLLKKNKNSFLNMNCKKLVLFEKISSRSYCFHFFHFFYVQVLFNIDLERLDEDIFQ
jgi:hypothetical protein